MAEVELDNVRENGVKMSVETKQNNLRDHILSWISPLGHICAHRMPAQFFDLCVAYPSGKF